MKKRISVFLMLFTAFILLSSCLYVNEIEKTVLDINTPVNETATIEFDGGFHVRKWNDEKIYTALDEVIIPAGNTSFLFDLYFSFGNQYSTTTYEFKDIELKYTFEPGKKYKIESYSKSLALGFKGIEFYVQLYDTTKRSEKLKEWMIGKK